MMHHDILLFFPNIAASVLKKVVDSVKQLDSFSYQGWIEKQANICKERFITKKY